MYDNREARLRNPTREGATLSNLQAFKPSKRMYCKREYSLCSNVTQDIGRRSSSRNAVGAIGEEAAKTDELYAGYASNAPRRRSAIRRPTSAAPTTASETTITTTATAITCGSWLGKRSAE